MAVGSAAGADQREVTTTETTQTVLPDATVRSIQDTWRPNLDGRLHLAMRTICEMTSPAPAVRRSVTSLFLPGVNEALRETERIESTEEQLRPAEVRHETVRLVRDVNGRWQITERQTGQRREFEACRF
jgi:hypothetical protein